MKSTFFTMLYVFSTVVFTAGLIAAIAVGTALGMVAYDVLSTKPAPVVEHVDRST